MLFECNNLTSKVGVSGRAIVLTIVIPMAFLWFPVETGAADEDDILFSDWEEQIEQVNEGELTLFETAPKQAVHQHINHLIIDQHSLDSGWVRLEQCHYGLDAVPALQITFAAGRVQDLAITSSENIGRSWVQGHTVQLQDIAANSSLCLTAKTLALKPEKHAAVLSNGPYMRRFLDGFYPMRVKLKISYPHSLLRFNQSSPVDFKVQKPGELLLDVWFEGELRTTVLFDRI